MSTPTHRCTPLALALSTLAILLAPLDSQAQDAMLPLVQLPASEPQGPTLWGPVNSIQARIVGASSSVHYAAVKSDVDANLAALASNPASLGDDALARLAKESALLLVLGVTPPATSTYANYRDPAVAALTSMNSRVSESLIGPNDANAIDVMQDSPRLQSMAEAYDLLRGSGVTAGDDTTIRNLIDNWAVELRNDQNLTGLVLGIAAHHDVLGLKGGSALITTALVLSSDPNAADWMSFANSLVSASIINVGSASGWYREGAYYLNSAMGDLFSTAVHVRYAAQVDWLTPLRPFVQAAFDMRQPDGNAPPFEDGVPCSFPFDVFAPYYADIGGQLVWAFNHSDMTPDGYSDENALEATRYLAGELPAEVAPLGRVSRLVTGDGHIAALRSSWDADAIQATFFAARDFENESSTLSTSYHDTNNPLDIQLAANGQIVLPTSGGGPEIEDSSNRDYYLKASSKNLPLVNGGAPWTTDGTRIATSFGLAGQDSSGLTGRYLELSRATFIGAYTAPSLAVARTVALIGGQYVAVIDEMDVQANQTAQLNLALHGRGALTIIDQVHSPIELGWSFMGNTLDTFTVGTGTLTVSTSSGYYAPSYGVEEAIQAAQVNLSGNSAHAITVLSPRAPADPALTVVDRTQANGVVQPGLLAIEVSQGAIVDHIASVSQPYALELDGGIALNDAGLPQTDIDGVVTDAVFSSVRESGGQVTGFGVANATSLQFDGGTLFYSGNPITVSFNASPSTDGGIYAAGYIGEVSTDQTGSSAFAVHGLAGFDPGVPWGASFEGQALASPDFIQLSDGFQFGALNGPGSLAVVAQGPEVLAPIPDQTVAEGQPLTFTLPATAPAGATLAFSFTTASNLGTGAAPTLDATTGVFAWTPGFDIATPAGPTDLVFNFVASSSAFSVSQPCHVRVTNVDRAPVLAPIPDKIVRRLTSVTLQLAATDADGDAITYSYVPTHAFPSPAPTFDAVHGIFSWNAPASAPLGSNPIVFTASDGQLSTSQTWLLTVQDVNHPPVFVSVNGQALADPTSYEVHISANSSLSLVFLATDADHDVLTVTARQPRGDLPTGATFAQSTLNWTPDASGSTTIIVHADDGHGGTADLTVTIDVDSSSGGCNSSGAPGAFALLFALVALSRLRRRALA